MAWTVRGGPTETSQGDRSGWSWELTDGRRIRTVRIMLSDTLWAAGKDLAEHFPAQRAIETRGMSEVETYLASDAIPPKNRVFHVGGHSDEQEDR